MLEQRFGKANVRVEPFPQPEGEVSPGLLLFPDDPARRLRVMLDGEDADARVKLLELEDAGTRWQLEHGLRPGLTLAQLVAANTAPLSFYGFAWDYGGSVHDWHGGRLANPVGAASYHHVELAPVDPAALDGLPQGDSSFRSDDARWPGLAEQVVVARVSISWPEAGD